jgi:hypothetical protein
MVEVVYAVRAGWLERRVVALKGAVSGWRTVEVAYAVHAGWLVLWIEAESAFIFGCRAAELIAGGVRQGGRVLA